ATPGSSSCATTATGPPPWRRWGCDPAGPHLLREHGARLLPRRGRVRRGGGGAHGAQPRVAGRRVRPRADLVDRVRAARRAAANPAAALRLVGGCGRLDPA